MDVVEPPMVVSAKSNPIASPERVSLRHRLEYAVLRSVVTLARFAPLRVVTATGATLGGSVGPLLRQNRRALANLEIAFPEKSLGERRRIARAMWANMGRIFAETLVFDRILRQPDRITILDEERWRARMGSPGPAIGCTLHMGNWELAVWPMTRFGSPPAGVYKPLGNPLVDRWLGQQRRALYPAGLLGKGESEDDPNAGQRTARQLVLIARGGGSIGFVADHFDRRGEPIAFMGRVSRFTTAPAMIARHVGARYWVGCCLRQGASSRFRVELRELVVPRSADKSADAVSLTTAMFAVFEEWIRAHPEQWMWWNTRWVQDADATLPAPRVATGAIERA